VRSCVAAIVLAYGCGRSTTPSATGTTSASSAKPDVSDEAITCDTLPFAASTPVPEASGAAWMTIDDKLVLVVVGDSGNHGAYGLVDPETGATTEQGALPLGDASDDLEGVSARDSLLYGLTSGGWMRVWKRVDHGFALVAGPYAIGKMDTGLAKQHQLHETPVTSDGIACDAHAFNCGHDFEGLALLASPPAAGSCVGVVVAKADGVVDCLTTASSRSMSRGRSRSATRARSRTARSATMACYGLVATSSA
jgi:hypothetical protein